jgi:hypothetical protein
MKDGITPPTLIAAIVVVIMALGGGWELMQSQFASVAKTQENADTVIKDREKLMLDRIERLEGLALKAARDPVEKATLDAIVAAIDKRDDLIQSQTSTQINDINRQIAAALVDIGANGAGLKKIPIVP